MKQNARNTRAKRLRTAQAKAKRRQDNAEAIRRSPATKTILGEAIAFTEGALDADWDDPVERGGHADAALTLFRGDTVLRRAFQEFGLDSRNPYHWKLLIDYMAGVLFAKRGRPKKW